jgi:hypothetical protein
MSSMSNERITPANNATITPDALKLRQLRENIRSNQNLAMGIVAGAAAAILGALTWGGLTFAIERQFGWMAIGVGLLVGFAVRRFGQGVDMVYGIVGAVLSLLGCVMGNLFTSCIVIADQEGVAISQVVAALNPSVIGQILTATFHPMDILFYAIAVYEGYRFSFRQLSNEELAALPAN